jgi:hypothetical protein
LTARPACLRDGELRSAFEARADGMLILINEPTRQSLSANHRRFAPIHSGGTRRSSLRGHLRTIAIGVLVATFLPAIILLLPVFLPALAAADVWEVHRLARLRCVACGAVIGREEIRRARQEARAMGRALVDATIARGFIPRILVRWEVRCHTCGQVHEDQPGSGKRPPLIAKA